MVRLLIAIVLLCSTATAQQSSSYRAARERMNALLEQLVQQAAEERRTEELADKPAEEVAPTKHENPHCRCIEEFGVCECKDCKCGEIIEPPIDLPKASVSVEWTEEVPVTSSEPQGNRCYMITSDSCPPCRRSKNDSPDLIGDAGDGKPVEMINISNRPNYHREMGIAYARVVPTWIVVQPDGRERVRTTGYQSNFMLKSFLTRHNVSENIAVDSTPEVVATINSEPSVNSIVAAFTEHLARSEPESEFPVGGLFDRDLSVPEQVPQILSMIMAGDPVVLDAAGLTVSWSGAGRQIEFVSENELKLNPPVSVRLEKWRMAVTTTLSGLEISDEGRTVRFVLKGPDFTVRFVP